MIEVERIINSFYSSNTYVIKSKSQKWALIDAGDIKEVIRLAKSENAKIEFVFLTHTHYDHIYGLNNLLEAFPDLVVYMSEHGKNALYSDKLNYSKYHNLSYTFKGSRLQFVDNLDVIDINNMHVEIFPTPGHSKDSVSYKIDNFFFTGDAYIPNVKVVTNLRGGDKGNAKKSVDLITAKLEKGMILCPGHGNIVDI